MADMTALLARAAPYLLMAMLASVVWLQRQTLASQAQTLAAYGQIIEQRGQELDLIAQTLIDQRQTLAALAAQQDGFRADLDVRRFDFERLKRDNAEVRRWADTRLPDDIGRLRQRPALTGAGAYDQYLRTRDTVPPASQPGTDQRRPTAAR